MSPQDPLRVPERGEVLKLGSPCAGEVVLVVDPASAGTTFSAGTQTLLPGAQMPVHKHRDRDLVLFVAKGQGRVTLGERVLNVVPGAMVHLPRDTWVGVRNTGTGTLQIAWASSPGLEAWFRDLSRLGGSSSAQALQELAQRHGIEFRPAGEEPPPARAGSRRGHRRGGRRHRGQGGPTPSSPPPSSVTSSPVPAGRPPTPPTAPATPAAPSGRRRHRRRGGSGRRSAPPASAPTPAASQPGSSRQRSSQRHHRRRVKEVYMGGRWVRVEGEGPVIAPGREGSERRSSKGDDDEPPPIRLSVPL